MLRWAHANSVEELTKFLLAVAVKEPLAVSQVNSLSTDDGQNLQVEVHGLQHPFRLFNIYQRPKCWNPEVFNPMAGLQQFWVCCGDFNFPVKDMHLGLLTGTGRHASSSQPIDAIWVSPKFSSCFDRGEIESFGNDHSIAWATLSVPHLVSPRLQDQRTLWKFRRHRNGARCCFAQPANQLCLLLECGLNIWIQLNRAN